MEMAGCRGRRARRGLLWGICFALFPWTAHAACTISGFGDNSAGQTTVPSNLGVVKQLAVGDAFTLALRVDGTVAAWGSDATGAVTATNGLTSVQSVAVGHAHALVAFQDGTVKVYGDTSFTNASVPFSLSQVVAVSAGLSCSFAVKQDGSISAWGDNIAVPDIDLANNQQNFKAVAARGKTVLGLRKDGTVMAFCGSSACSPPAGLSNVIQIAATETARVALKDNGTVVAWGTGTAATVPVGLQDVVWIAASADVVMAGKSDGTVVAWGNTAGITGMTTAVGAAKDVWIGGLGSNFGLVYACAAGCGDTGPFGCCQSDTLQICDDAGQLTYATCNMNTCGWNYSTANACDASGIGYPELGLRKDCLPTGCLPNCTGAVCGDDGCGGTCGTCPSGQFCNIGQCLGNCSAYKTDCQSCICNVDNTCCTTPWDAHCDNLCVGSGCDSVCSSATCTPKCSGKACGDDGCGGACGTCGLNETCDTGTFQCVVNGGGDIGDAGSGFDDTISDAISSDAGSSGTVTTCGVYGYGSNSSGETTIPADIGQVVQLASASYFSLALRKDGTVKAWGAVPTDLQAALATGIPGVKAIAAGDQHALFVMNDGTVTAYGLGAGGNATLVPSGLTGVSAVAAGYSSSFALKDDGSVVAWGTSSDGLGAVEAANGATGFATIGAHNGMAAGIKTDGSVVAFSTDASFSAPSNLQAQALAFDASYMYALKADGTVSAWGSINGIPAMPVSWTKIVAISGGNAGLAGVTQSGTLEGLGSVLNGAAPTGVSMFAVGGQFLIAAQCPASCGAIGPTGCCDGDNVKTCDSSGAISSGPCATGTCGWSADGYACNTSGKSAANNIPPRACPTLCTPNCTGKNCGPDGCGGSCGDCAPTQSCGSDGVCKCVPDCNGKTCGSDGCGGSCGLCPGGTSCDATTQQCKCTPKCGGKVCGPDGCGGTCGTCATGASCGTNNQCQNMCVPSCAGKTCGSDGCGGSCGFCAASDGLFCDSTYHECRDTGCPNIPLFGCCDGETAKYCAAGHVEVTKDCHAAGLYCGWAYNPDPLHPVLATSAAYMCEKTPGSVDKYGTPRTCPGSAACVPNCTGKGCGSDGCGGSCGTCGSGTQCEFSTGKCKGSACAGVPYEGCCKNGTAVSCNQSDGSLAFTPCKPLNTAAGQACGWGGTAFQCLTPTWVMVTPAGKAKDCPASVCVPNCTGKSCGSDGCGGTCGACKGDQTCQPDGTCKSPCVPSCYKQDITSYGGTYHYCGYDDGCGGTCGCKDGQFCNVYGYGSIKPGYCQNGMDTCKPAGVTPANCCVNNSQLKTCSDGQVQSQNCQYGCGWSKWNNAYYCLYGPADASDVLTDPSGAHPLACPGSVACVPLCKDKQCGPDGCGGTCGSCADGQKCDQDGKCMDKCANNVGFEGCCNGDVLKMCAKTSFYSSADTIGLTQCAPGTCGWKSADGKYGCNSSGGADPSGKHVKACDCVPSCIPGYQTCGSDGCTGSCGTCPTGKVCHAYDYYGITKQECCTPNCSGKVCGDDGCGGSCGSCGTGTACDSSTGKCATIPPPPTCQNTKWQGACNGEVLQYCTGTQIVTQNCGSSLHCGWNAGLGAYSCGTAGGADPSGQFPKEAAGTKALCIPNCTGRECGLDGCGGACGSYQCKEDYYICNKTIGQCQVDYDGEWWWSKHPLPPCPDGQVINKVTGGCKSDNGGACGPNSVHTGTLCGQQASGWTCQCDPDCTTRGDCCSDYYSKCPAPALGTTACGDKTCDASKAESCADCPADCGTCAAFTGTSPPWRSPLNEILTLPGTAAQKEQTVASGPESLLPADSPWPRAGLLAYLPRDGVLYGSPYNFTAAGSTGTFSSVAGAQGQAIRFGNTGLTAPSDGTARIKLWSALPAIDSAKDKTLGGLTLAMWLRVPTSAPTTVNPLASLKDMGMSAYLNGKPICQATRPGDTTLKITCPSDYPTISPTVSSVYAWYGPASTPPNAGNVACDSLEKAGVSPTCSDPGILAAVEKACLGNTTCTVNLTPPSCATGSTVAFVRAMCTYGSGVIGPSIAVDSSANGSKLMFVQDPSSPLQSTTSIKDGLWHHVAVTLRPLEPGGRRGMTYLYVDGELQGSSDTMLYGHFDEVVLGAGSLLGTGANWSVTKTSGVGDVDEVFVYNRALSDAEVRALKNKRDFGFLRQWPATSAEQVVTMRLGIASGTPTVTAVTNPAVALQEGPSKPLTASWSGLTVQGGNYAQLQEDSDLASMSSWTLMGWIRADSVAAGGTLLQLTKGANAQAALTLTSDCDGLGVKGTVGSNSTPVSSCEHGLRANTWQFVALVQNGQTLQAYLDGALVGTLTTTGTTPTILGGTGNVGLQTGTGVALGWSALANRAMTAAELEQWRNPGPAVWMDGFHYVDSGKGRMRDYANFANFSSKTTQDVVEVFDNKGASWQPTAGGTALTLSLGNSTSSEVRIAARGRLRATGTNGVRPFAFTGRVTFAPGSVANVPLVSNATGDGQTSWTPKMNTTLKCTRTTAALSCNFAGSSQLSDGTWKTWTTETRSAAVGNVAVDVDVAVSFDGTDMHFALSSPDATFGAGTVGATGPGGGTPVGYVLTTTPATGTALPKETATAVPNGAYFRMTPPASFTGATAPAFALARLYPRPLSNTELGQQVLRSCTDQHCSDINRSCVDSGQSLPVCGNCSAGSFEVSGTHGGQCYVRKSYGGSCAVNAECVSGFCQNGACGAKDLSADCTTFCHAKGRECVMEFTGYSFQTATCASACLPYYTQPGLDHFDPNVDCIWSPDADVGEVCAANDECKSGSCSSVSDYVYNFTVDRSPACKADGTCPGWQNTADSNKPFKCDKRWDMDLDLAKQSVCMWVPTGNTQVSTVQRCDATSQQACADVHRNAVLANKSGINGTAMYKCGDCDPTTWTNSLDGKTYPLWVKRWRLLSPEACQLMHTNLVRAFVGGKFAEIPGFLFEPFSAATLGQFILEKPPGSILTPAEFAKLITKGVGPELIDYVLDSDVRATWDAKYPSLMLADCAVDSAQPKAAPFNNKNDNYQVCAPNQFPDGSPCPPDGVDASLADSFCQSGFCARDTHKCEEGYGILEDTQSASRNDHKASEDASVPPVQFVQQNTPTLQFKKVKKSTIPNTAMQERNYSMSLTNSNTLSFFGTSMDVMSISNTLSGVMNGPDEAVKFNSTVSLFGVSVAMPGEPPLKCPGTSWKDGKMVEAPPPHAACDRAKPSDISVGYPTLHFCSPSPGECHEDPANSPFNTVQKAKGPLCIKRFVFVGPVPVTIEVSLVIEACLSFGTAVDPDSLEGSFEIDPEINVAVEARGGVGGEIGPVEVFAGVKAAITILNLILPIKWATTVTQLQDDQNKDVENLYKLGYARSISAVLNTLKLSLSAFAEAAVSVVSVEWEFSIFEYGGLTFEWQLTEPHEIFAKKVDLQHKTANQ